MCLVVWPKCNIKLAVNDLIDIRPSPSKIPTNFSFKSWGKFIADLSAEDKRLIPLVERLKKKIKLLKNIILY